jgi:ComF family protein
MRSIELRPDARYAIECQGGAMELSNFSAREFDSEWAGRPFSAGLRRLIDSSVRFARRALPQSCTLCAAPSGDVLLCDACSRALPWTRAVCPVCALPTIESAICGACLARPPPFAATVAAWLYAFPVDQLMQAFKYGGQLALAEPLSGALVATARRLGVLPPDAIVALPLAPSRQRERGFNQAHEIAKRVACSIGVPLVRGLVRVRDAAPQAGLSLEERARNMKNAFVANGAIAGRHIAIVDDVMTTGATLAAAARAARRAGAASVDAWVVARTPAPGQTRMR